MKVTAISDLHGNLIDIEPCDLLLICGDISPLDIQRDYIQMTKWIFNEFQEWIMKIDCPTIILTNVRVANVSILDESYSIYFKPTTFEL